MLKVVVVLLALPMIRVPWIPFAFPVAMAFGLVVLTFHMIQRPVQVPVRMIQLFLLLLLAQAASLAWGAVMDTTAIAHLRTGTSDSLFLSEYRFIWQIGAWVLGFGLFVFAVDQLRVLKDLRSLARAYLVASLLVASFGYYELAARALELPYFYPATQDWHYVPSSALDVGAYYLPRIYSSFAEPKYLAHYLLFPVFLALSTWFVTLSLRYLLLTAYLAGVLFLTFSTTGLFGLVLGSLVVALTVGKGRILTAGLTAFLLVGAWMYFGNFLAATAALHATRFFAVWSDQGIMFDVFIARWRVGWELFSASPLLGIGIGNSPLYSGVDEQLSTPLNLYLLLLAETGIVGFGTFCLLIATPIVRLMRLLKGGLKGALRSLGVERAILVAALASFVGGAGVYGAFGGDILFAHDWVILAVIAKGAALLNRAKRLAQHEAPLSR